MTVKQSNIFRTVLFVIVFSVVGGHLVLSAPPPVKAAIIYKSGTLPADETWTADNVYVINNTLTVATGVTLTIEAGTVVKFQYSGRYLVVDGTLDAQGTAANPVVFTSFKDDDYGGDTNGDGYASTASAGDWSGIQFKNGSQHSNFQYVIVRYGGYGGAMVRSYGAYLTVQHALLEFSSGDGLYISHSASDPDIIVRYCTFRSNNGSGIDVAGS